MAHIGPSLPPGFAAMLPGEEGSDEDQLSATVGPFLPPTSKNADSAALVIGPSMPIIGPSIPPQSSVTPSAATATTYGPMLPPQLSSPATPTARGNNESPTHSESEEGSEDEVIGPMPNTEVCVGDLERKRLEIEARAQAMKDKLTGKDKETAPKREEWMTVLPADFKPLGVGARKFRTKVPNMGDRSVWTDTPADKIRKLEEARTGRKIVSKTERDQAEDKKRKTDSEYAYVAARDKEMAQRVQEYNKEHRSKSLMDMHRKRKTDEVKAKGGDKERRPFDRETDLEAPRNMVTPSKRMAIMNDSKLSLNNKFQHGSRSFL